MLSESQLNSCTLLQAMVPESLFGVKLQHPLIMSALDDEMREISDTEGDKVSDILGWQRLQSILNQCERALKSPETTRFQAQELFSKCVGKPHLYGDGSSAEQMKRERVKLRWLPTALLGSSYFSGKTEEEMIAAIKETFDILEEMFSTAMEKLRNSSEGRDTSSIVHQYHELTRASSF